MPICLYRSRMPTPLALAIKYNHIEAVRLLLDNRAHVCHMFEDLRVIEGASDDAFKLLMDYGYDTMIAKRGLSKGAFKYLRTSELILNCGGSDGSEDSMDRIIVANYMLCTCIEDGCVKGVNIALKYGYDINACSIRACIITTVNNNSKEVEMDLTPLQYAIANGQKKVVKALIDRGADKAIKNSNDLTAKDMAILTQQFDLIGLVS